MDLAKRFLSVLKINTQDIYGITPLQFVIQQSKFELVDVALRDWLASDPASINGAFLNKKNELGNSIMDQVPRYFFKESPYAADIFIRVNAQQKLNQIYSYWTMPNTILPSISFFFRSATLQNIDVMKNFFKNLTKCAITDDNANPKVFIGSLLFALDLCEKKVLVEPTLQISIEQALLELHANPNNLIYKKECYDSLQKYAQQQPTNNTDFLNLFDKHNEFKLESKSPRSIL